MLHTRGSSGAFDDLASLDDLDHMVSSTGLSTASLRIVRDGATLPASSYTVAPPRRSRAGDPQVSAARVYEHFYEGATIVLESLHRYWPPLTDFCRDLELALGHRLQVNAYITPPGSQGFAVHRDDHDVFVLQTSGSKSWMVYDRDEDDVLLVDEVLERGAALYIPEGFPHAARTGQSASAHLTVGVITHEASEVVRALTRLAEDEPVFRARLTPAASRDPAALRRAVESHVEDLRVWLDKVDLDVVTERVARRVMTTAQPILRGQLSQLARLEALTEDSVLTRRRGSTCVVFSKGEVVRAVLSDRELEMPAVAEAALREIARRDRIAVRDLHDVLDPASSLVLVRRLVREGLLEVLVAD